MSKKPMRSIYETMDVAELRRTAEAMSAKLNNFDRISRDRQKMGETLQRIRQMIVDAGFFDSNKSTIEHTTSEMVAAVIKRLTARGEVSASVISARIDDLAQRVAALENKVR